VDFKTQQDLSTT